VTLDSVATMADGIAVRSVSELTLAHVQAYVDEVVTVEDGALRDAMRALFDRMKLVSEPSGAIAVAALLERLVVPHGPTVAVLSGGNIEWSGVQSLLSER
jgi:threonine dehydratase